VLLYSCYMLPPSVTLLLQFVTSITAEAHFIPPMYPILK